MGIPKINFACLLAVGIATAVTSSLNAQVTTLDGFNKSSNSVRQKSPQRQLAQRIAPQEDKKNKQLPAKQVAPKKDSKSAGNTPEKKPTPQPITKQRRAELMAFVKANHPELQPLLNQLQSKREKQFQTVLRTLDRNVKNLQVLEKKSAPRYKRALELWGVTSRIQLLSAQLAIKKSEKEKNSIRNKLRTLFEQQFELQKEQVVINTEAAKKKYDKLAEQLKTLESNRDATIVRKLEEIDKTSARVSAQQKKLAEKKKLEKTKNVKTENPKMESVPKKSPPTGKTKPAVKSEKEKAKK